MSQIACLHLGIDKVPWSWGGRGVSPGSLAAM